MEGNKWPEISVAMSIQSDKFIGISFLRERKFRATKGLHGTFAVLAFHSLSELLAPESEQVRQDLIPICPRASRPPWLIGQYRLGFCLFNRTTQQQIKLRQPNLAQRLILVLTAAAMFPEPKGQRSRTLGQKSVLAHELCRCGSASSPRALRTGSKNPSQPPPPVRTPVICPLLSNAPSSNATFDQKPPRSNAPSGQMPPTRYDSAPRVLSNHWKQNNLNFNVHRWIISKKKPMNAKYIVTVCWTSQRHTQTPIRGRKILRFSTEITVYLANGTR